MTEFKLNSEFTAKGDQPHAIDSLCKGIEEGKREQILLGVTGSGKTFTMASIVEKTQRPTLVLAHNKTLAAQLYNEFKLFFPDNAVEYFVSYYDYYQPEAYLPKSDTYIEKDSSVNDEIDMMRHSATRSLLERRDVLIVASVSCIYGLGSPEEYKDKIFMVNEGEQVDRDAVLEKFVGMLYERNNIDFKRGTFRVNGDILEIFPSYEGESAIRLEFFGDEVERISKIDPLTGKVLTRHKAIIVYPNSHYVTSDRTMERAVKEIKKELIQVTSQMEKEGKLVEAQRLSQRTMFDLEMLKEMGFCHGIENYSRLLTGRKPGEPPPTLLDYYPEDFLLFIDESHATVPQVGGMYAGDRSRKETLVSYGFRLPSALDNRPLNFKEFEKRMNQVIYVTATPGPYERGKCGGSVVEQVVRPTGLMDPPIEIRPVKGQVDDLLAEIRDLAKKGDRALVTTLTKKFSEDLTDYLINLGVRVRYLHSGIDTLERMRLIRELRLGEYDVLVGINLLREGLDIPEVALVAILDADKEGFLRSETSLIQTCGRAARNVEGRVIMYGDKITGSMERAIKETERRRKIQMAYNKKHKITPSSIKREIHGAMGSVYDADYVTVPVVAEEEEDYLSTEERTKITAKLHGEMLEAAEKLDFERAAELRDQIRKLQDRELGIK